MPTLFLVGNNAVLDAKRHNTYEQALECADLLTTQEFETSASRRQSVNELWGNIADALQGSNEKRALEQKGDDDTGNGYFCCADSAE
jgi:hypothetical protein